MTWEETIKHIRTLPEFYFLVEKAYFDENLPLNVERFKASEEYQETLRLLKLNKPHATSILDIGSGNGISAIAFALDGYEVTVSEPDGSLTVGAGAIRLLKEHYGLTNIEIHEAYAENVNFGAKTFDVVYVRQAMHHANDLQQFIKNIVAYLKPTGMLFTVRDHVIYNEEDKALFLSEHPLQKFYGGENAFTVEEYTNAIENAGLTLNHVYKHFDNVINYFPLSNYEYFEKVKERERILRNQFSSKVGILAHVSILFSLYKKRVGFSPASVFDETIIPGRMYSFLATKK